MRTCTVSRKSIQYLGQMDNQNSLYVAGDGAGLTRGLSQAGANGILVARDIVKKLS